MPETPNAGVPNNVNFNRLRLSPANTPASLIPPMPAIPDDVKKRFPSMTQWERQIQEWQVSVNIALRGAASGIGGGS